MPLCMGCLNEITTAESKCKHCGFDNSKKQIAPFLPYGSTLANKYVVAKNLDYNGESTRYLGYDNSSGKVVTIREFLPIGLFDRKQGETKVTVPTESKKSYNEAFTAFEKYYETLTTLTDMSALVQIFDVFEANNTCYVVEDNEELIPFTEYLDRNGGQLEWDEARPLFMPIISLLEALHKNEIGHYAVSPSNLFVTPEGKLKLAAFSTENERKRGTMLKSQLFSGCAAPEQYEQNKTLDCSTDIYGFTATLFKALTGNLPATAQDRVKDPRLLISTNTVKRLPPHVVSALANGLQVNREDRISDFDELRSQLSVSSTVKAIQDEISRTASMTPIKRENEKKSKVKPGAVGIVATIAALLVFSAVGLFWLSINPLQGLFKTDETTPTQPSTVVEDWTGPVVADYVGKTYEQVVTAVSADKSITIKVSADGEFSDTVPKGTVISQQPKAGEPITLSSSVVYIVLSKGPEMVALPDIAEKSVSAAAEKLTDLGFVVLQDAEYNDTIRKDYVIDYSERKAGDKVESGSEIKLRVSLGKENMESSQQ